ncbi:MAG: MmgE/PrpD family protein [Halobacterium sp.]
MAETEILAEFVTETELADVPPDVRAKAKEAITDFVGVALFGSQHEVGETMWSHVSSVAAGDDATVICRGTASPTGAALANGAFGHAVDYDDTFESIVIHPTSPVFSAALAAGEAADASGAEILAGYVVGVEAAFRTGHATYPSHYDNGWHSTGTVGTFGATAAAASVLGLSTDETRHAFGVAASSSSSLKKNFGTMTKPYHAGHAAQMGVRAAMLAADGFTADADVFEGPIGYGEVMTPGGTYDPSEITDGLGDSWAVMDVGYKPYPSGVITHAAMDALRGILVDEGLTADDVESVTVALDDAASEMLHHENPEDALQAKFSIEFCLAAILRERDAGIREFTDDYLDAPETRAEMAKVSRAFEENLFGGDFANYAARVSVTTTDGETFTAEEKHAPGSPNNPISDERMRAKFDECASVVLADSDAEAAYEAIRSLDEAGALDRLRDAVRP